MIRWTPRTLVAVGALVAPGATGEHTQRAADRILANARQAQR